MVKDLMAGLFVGLLAALCATMFVDALEYETTGSCEYCFVLPHITTHIK